MPGTGRDLILAFYAFHDVGVGVEDIVRVVFVHFEGPVVAVEGAAEEDAVGAREHMAGADVAVVDLGLRQQHFELSPSGDQLFVAEELPGTEAAAVEDHGLA